MAAVGIRFARYLLLYSRKILCSNITLEKNHQRKSRILNSVLRIRLPLEVGGETPGVDGYLHIYSLNQQSRWLLQKTRRYFRSTGSKVTKDSE